MKESSSLNSEDLNILNIYFDEISKIPILNPIEERELITLYKNGNELAKNKLIESNLRLVVSIANKFVNRGLPLEDLIGEGNTGLVIALEYYNLEEKVKFATYATPWINKMIKIALIKCCNIPLSPGLYYKIKNLKKKYKELSDLLIRKPSLAEFSSYTNTSENKIIELLEYDYITFSIYDKINDESDAEFVELIVDDKLNLEDEIIERDFKKQIHYIIFESNILDKEQIYIICRRFGFNCNIATFREIGKSLNISGEAVRQKFKKALTHIINIYGTNLLGFTNVSNGYQIIEEAKNGKFKIMTKKDKLLTK